MSGEVIGHLIEKGAGPKRIAVHAEVRENEQAAQPSPDCALVVRGVSMTLVAPVVTAIAKVRDRKGSQPSRCQQFARADV